MYLLYLAKSGSSSTFAPTPTVEANFKFPNKSENALVKEKLGPLPTSLGREVEALEVSIVEAFLAADFFLSADSAD